MTTSAPGDPLSLVGKTLAGHFLVQSLAAEGHTSFVYRGEHVGPKRPVALKCLKITVDLDAARADTFLKRLREETRAYSQASRNEPHFVRSIGTGMTATGSGRHVPYSVLEWLDGKSLAADCKERKAKGVKPRTLAETAELLAPTARALAAVHAQNLSHGDISARNIFLLKNPMSGYDTKLLDFGVAKVIRDVSRELATSAAPPPAEDPFWIPSPGYAAPEQLRRELGDIGPWTDVYAFAVVFLETMCDRPLGTPTPLLSQMGLTLPETVERVLARALMESPTDRWPRGGEFWAALEDSLRVSAIQVPSRPPPPLPPGAQTLRLGNPVAPAAPAVPPGKQTVRLGGGPPAAAPRVAGKPALLPAAATRVPPAAGKPVVPPAAGKPVVPPVRAPMPTPLAAPTPATLNAAAPPAPAAVGAAATIPMTPELVAAALAEVDDGPIKGTPVVLASPPIPPPPPPPTNVGSPVVKTAPMPPIVAAGVPAQATGPNPLPPRGGATTPIAAASPISSGPVSSSAVSSGPSSSGPGSSGPSSVPPPPPPPGAILEVAPGPLPPSPSSTSSGSPLSENARSVSASAPAARAQVSMESLPSVIVAEAEGPPVRPGGETVRLHNPPSSDPRMQVAMQMGPHSSPTSGPPSGGMPSHPGLPPPPVMARPGVIVMPSNMMQGPPSSSQGRLSYDERRARERKRVVVVLVVSFALAFLVGGGFLALRFRRSQTTPSMAATHSANN